MSALFSAALIASSSSQGMSKKTLETGFDLGKVSSTVFGVIDVALVTFSFSYGGFSGFLGSIVSGLDLALNYDTWVACKDGAKVLEEKPSSLHFLNAKNLGEQKEGFFNLLREACVNTVFWKAVIPLVKNSYPHSA